MRETYSQQHVSNEGRPTCVSCGVPCGLTREYRAVKLCETCYRTDLPPLTTQPKELIHAIR
jgi:ribosomal protein S14